MTRVKALEAGQSSQGTSEPITPVFGHVESGFINLFGWPQGNYFAYFMYMFITMLSCSAVCYRVQYVIVFSMLSCSVCYRVQYVIVFSMLSCSAVCYRVQYVIVFSMVSYSVCYRVQYVIVFSMLSCSVWYRVQYGIVFSMLSCSVCYRVQYGIVFSMLSCSVWCRVQYGVVFSMVSCSVCYRVQYGIVLSSRLVCWSLTSLCHSNGHIDIKTIPAREINPFTALTRIRSQFLRTQWSTRVNTTTPQTAQPSGLAMCCTEELWKMPPATSHITLITSLI